MNEGTKCYSVYVYNNHVRATARRPHRNKPLAYLRYQGDGFCLHYAMAKNVAQAKLLALGQHEYDQCSKNDRNCLNCPGL